MFARRTILLLLALTLLPHSGWAFEDFGLRVLPTDPADETVELGMDERLSRIDAIEALLADTHAHHDSLLIELGRLYSGSPFMKHRVWAFELQTHLEEPDSFDALRDRAYRYGAVWNPWESERTWSELVEKHPDVAAAHRDRGVFLLETGLHTLDQERLQDALASFRRALQCEDAGYQEWLGLAAALLATNHRHELKDVGEKLMTYPEGELAGRLYAGVGFHARGLNFGAESAFRSAMSRMSFDSRSRFLDLEGFLAQFQPLLIHDSMLERLAPRRLLGWWVRLVEAEVLFSDPQAGVHSWDTGPGEVYLMFGRPTHTRYFPPFHGLTIEDMQAFAGEVVHANDLAFAFSDIPATAGLGAVDGTWLWILDMGGVKIPYVFVKGAAFAKWRSTYHSENQHLHRMRNALPLALSAPPPDPEPGASIGFSARHATFWTGTDVVRAESYVGVKAINVPDHANIVATLTIVDDDGAVVETAQRPVDLQQKRQDMLARIPGTTGETSGALTSFSALLPPGRYVFRIEVEDAEHGVYEATDQGFRLREMRAEFDMSDLQLVDSFANYRADMDLPAEFVKYARAVMPHPEYRVHPGQENIYAYYEVYGTQPDETGRAHLETLYEIFDRQNFDPLDAGRPDNQARDRATFPDERIGRSSTGMVVKGTVVDVADLAPGHYVLAVRVTDLITRRETMRFIPFAK